MNMSDDDRTLWLTPAQADSLSREAAVRPTGLMVVLADQARVGELRLALRSFDNVMIHTHEPGEIPWRDGVFTVVIDPQRGWPMDPRALVEVARVLSPGGRWKDAPAEAHALLTQVGFTSEGSDLVKPAEAAAPPSLRVLR